MRACGAPEVTFAQKRICIWGEKVCLTIERSQCTIFTLFVKKTRSKCYAEEVVHVKNYLKSYTMYFSFRGEKSCQACGFFWYVFWLFCFLFFSSPKWFQPA